MDSIFGDMNGHVANDNNRVEECMGKHQIGTRNEEHGMRSDEHGMRNEERGARKEAVLLTWQKICRVVRRKHLFQEEETAKYNIEQSQ